MQINEEYLEFVKALQTIYHYRLKHHGDYKDHFNDNVALVIDALLEIANEVHKCPFCKNKYFHVS